MLHILMDSLPFKRQKMVASLGSKWLSQLVNKVSSSIVYSAAPVAPATPLNVPIIGTHSG